MYHAIVRRRARRGFERLSRGDLEGLLSELAEDVHHVFPGDHPLGGARRSKAAVRAWFERLDRLFPGHEFDVRRVVSRGWPWRTLIAVEWTATLRPAVGDPYTNEGAHIIEARWGKTMGFHAYLDTQRVADECARMARAGVEEAAAPPITD